MFSDPETRIPGDETPWPHAPSYAAWRAEKLSRPDPLASDPVEIRSLNQISTAEKFEIIRRCDRTNLAAYHVRDHPRDLDQIRDGLRSMAQEFGLISAENHRSAGDDGVVALREIKTKDNARFIPYSKKPMNWHTDGYYNGPEDKIRAFVLHCAVPAQDGGRNQFVDPEIAYIRLRDENPAYVQALSHPQAMTIPQNQEADGSIRAESVGPVFSNDPTSGKLEMRYTARTRSIKWRDDPILRQAVDFLNQWLASDDPFIQSLSAVAGQGVLSNNALHNRTGFDGDITGVSPRIMLRLRFHNRVSGT